MLEVFGLDFQPGLFDFDISKLLVLLGEQGLKVANLGDERGADFSSELDVVYAIGGLVPDFAVRDIELRGRSSGLTLELGRADGALHNGQTQKSATFEERGLTLPILPSGT